MPEPAVRSRSHASGRRRAPRVSTTSSPSTTKRPSTWPRPRQGARAPRRPCRRPAARWRRRASSCPRRSRPVSAVMPGPSTSAASAITPRSVTASSVSTSAHQRSVRPNFGFRMRWKSLPERRTRRTGWSAAVHTTAPWPSSSTPRRRPSTDTVAGRWPLTVRRIDASGASTIERSKSMCGDTGVSTSARWAGDDRAAGRERVGGRARSASRRSARRRRRW